MNVRPALPMQSLMIPHVSGFPSNMNFPSFSPCERQPQNSLFISQSSGSIPHFPSTVLDDDNSWGTDQLQDLQDFPEEGVPLSVGQVGNYTEFISNDNHVNRFHWRELNDDNLYVDSMEPKPSEFITNSKLPQSLSYIVVPKQAIQRQLSSANSVAASQSNKPRMRWTQELHEAFVNSINQLGGCEKATPKGVLGLMTVDGLTIDHIKSHLQKYRAERMRSKSSEGNSDDKTSAIEQESPVDLKTSVIITEALRMQMKVQKHLHQQLEIQRKMQLQMEEQGKYLLQMLESRNKAEKDKFPCRGDWPSSPDDMDRFQAVAGTSTSSQALAETSHGSKEKQHVLETSSRADQCPEACESDPTTMKRARTDDSLQK